MVENLDYHCMKEKWIFYWFKCNIFFGGGDSSWLHGDVLLCCTNGFGDYGDYAVQNLPVLSFWMPNWQIWMSLKFIDDKTIRKKFVLKMWDP